MASESGCFSDSQSEFSSVSDELSPLESSYSQSESDGSDKETRDLSGKGSKSDRKRKTLAGRTSATGSRGKKQVQTTDKKVAKGLSFSEMDELSLWVFDVFSNEEAMKVESELRQRLLKSPRLKAFDERRKFASHLTSEAQRGNFSLLITGFCRKFATLSKECYRTGVIKERKAAFSLAWMKLLANFQPGKKSQERIILERCLPAHNIFSHEDVHSLLSVIHELVYTVMHDHIRTRN